MLYLNNYTFNGKMVEGVLIPAVPCLRWDSGHVVDSFFKTKTACYLPPLAIPEVFFNFTIHLLFNKPNNASKDMWFPGSKWKLKVETSGAGTGCWWHASHVCAIHETVRDYNLTLICFMGGGGGLRAPGNQYFCWSPSDATCNIFNENQ